MVDFKKIQKILTDLNFPFFILKLLNTLKFIFHLNKQPQKNIEKALPLESTPCITSTSSFAITSTPKNINLIDYFTSFTISALVLQIAAFT